MSSHRQHTIVVIFGTLIAALLTGCARDPVRRMVDLTYPFDEHTIYWPNNQPFRWEKVHWGATSAGYWYASAIFSTSEHGGTHIDAPIHFAEGRHTLDQIPLQQLAGPGIVIDVRSACQTNPDYALTRQDIIEWESRHGRIPDGAIVFMWSGWGQHWPDRHRYFGTDTPDDPRTLHFPGFSADAAEFLVTQRKIHGAAIDTASIDPGQSRDFPVHRILNGANVYALENIADLEGLPPSGATILALPMKIAGGTGGPVRVLAWVP